MAATETDNTYSLYYVSYYDDSTFLVRNLVSRHHPPTHTLSLHTCHSAHLRVLPIINMYVAQGFARDNLLNGSVGPLDSTEHRSGQNMSTAGRSTFCGA